MTDTDLLRAELEVAELSDRFAEVKAAHSEGNVDHDTYRAAKQALHDKRVAFRKLRESKAAELAAERGEGDAVVTPDTVHASAAAKEANQ